MKIYGLIEKIKAFIGNWQSAAPTLVSGESSVYFDADGDPRVVIGSAGADSDLALPTSTHKTSFSASGEGTYNLPASGTTIETTAGSAQAASDAVDAHDVVTGVHGVGTGDVVGTDKVQTLTNKKLDGGTASSNNAWKLPAKAGESGPLAEESSAFYDSNTKQLKVFNGTTWVAASGDVAGPSSATDKAIVRFNGTTGKIIQGYTSNAPTISDTGVIDPVGGFGTTANGSASATASGLLNYRDNILCKYYGSTSSPGTSSPAVIKFDTKKYETYSSDCYSPSTGWFTAPRAGYYRFTAGIISGSENYTTGSAFNMYLYTNSSSPTKVSLMGSTYAQTTYNTARLHVLGSITVYLAAGGTAAIYGLTPGGVALDLTSEEHNWICVERVGF